jgi:hypothetical protein
MKRKLVLFLLMLASSLHSFATTPVQNLARAIAKAEGFYTRGSKPARLHNPGDIRSQLHHAYPGQVGIDRQGYVLFRNDRAGWAALEAQIDRIAAGDSKFYTVNSTLKQMARRYATSPTWIRNVAHNLGVTPDTQLWEILDVPPLLP